MCDYHLGEGLCPFSRIKAKTALGSLKRCTTSNGAILLRSLGLMALIGFALQSNALGATFHLRADGTATDPASATSCSSPATAMSLDMPRYVWEDFAPGDHIVLCSEGGVFRGELQALSTGTAAAPITYDGRGSAVVQASDLVNGWTLHGGNVYIASLSDAPKQVFIDGVFGTRRASVAEIVGHLDWYWDNGQLFLLSMTGNPDLAFQNPGVEAGVRNWCVRTVGSHVVITGITARHSNRNGIGGWEPGSYITIRNSVAEWNWDNGIAFEGYALYENNIIEDNVGRNNGVGAIGIAGAGKNAIIRRNVCHSNGKYQSANAEFDYYHQWTHGIKLFENETNHQEGHEIYENVVYDNGRGYVGDKQGRGTGIWIDTVPGHSDNPIVIRHNLIYSNAGNGVFIEISSNTVVMGNVLHNNANNLGSTGGAVPANIVIDSRAYYHSDNNRILNNTLYGGQYGIKLNTYGQQSGCSLSNNIIKNNIVVGASDHTLFARDGGDNDGVWGSGNVYENNGFGTESNDFIRWGGVPYNTYSDWESAYGSPSYSIESDPQLVGTSRDSLYLTAASPCRDAGENLGTAYDDALVETSAWVSDVVTGDQNQHGSDWEVGAYLYSGQTPVLFADGFESGNTDAWVVSQS